MFLSLGLSRTREGWRRRTKEGLPRSPDSDLLQTVLVAEENFVVLGVCGHQPNDSGKGPLQIFAKWTATERIRTKLVILITSQNAKQSSDQSIQLLPVIHHPHRYETSGVLCAGSRRLREHR